MATRANPSREARPQAQKSKTMGRNSNLAAVPAVPATPVYALVLELVSGEPPHAKVLSENGDFRRDRYGDAIKRIDQLQNAVMAHVGGSFEVYRREYEGDPLVYAKDPRDGGRCTDRRTSNPRPLTINIEKDEGVHSGSPVDSAHRTFENPYFVLVRRKQAVVEIAAIGEAVAAAEQWEHKEEEPGVQICYMERSTEDILGTLDRMGADHTPPRTTVIRRPETPPLDLSTLVADILRQLQHSERDALPEALRQLLRPERTLPLGVDQQTVLPTLMERADTQNPADRLVWNALADCFTRAKTSTNKSSFVFLTGTSGAGKSKIAADIGKQDALVVTVPVLTTHDNFSASSPYTLLFSRLDRLREQAEYDPTRRAELQERAIICFAHMVLSHLEVVLEVCERATESGIRDRSTLLEVAIRAQGGPYTKFVSEYFKTTPVREDRNEGRTELHARFRTLLDRSSRVLGDIAIVMFHDEAQVLLDEHGCDDFFEGAWRTLQKSQTLGLGIDLNDPEAQSKPKGYPHSELFYALICTIRYLSDGEFATSVGHVVAGTNMRMTFYMLTKESPAQGAAKHVNVATCLSADDICNWCASYLSDEAMAAFDDDAGRSALDALQGRPLFASCFWGNLVGFSSSDLSAVENVRQAIELALKNACDDARTRVEQLWRQVESHAVLYGLYYSLKAGYGGSVRIKPPAMLQLQQAILEGVLNIEPTETMVDIDLRTEPATAKAILDVGDEFLAATGWHDDPVVQSLLGRRIGLFGSEEAKGELLGQLFVWHVLKTCRKAGGSASLKAVLWGDQDGKYWPTALDGLTVEVKYGLRCPENDAGFLSKFEGEGGVPRFDVALHHPPHAAASGDVLLPARKGECQFQQVMVQCKDLAKSDLPEALRSLDMGKWYPDQMTKHGRVRTQPNHAFVTAFSEHPDWFARPVRAVLHTKQFKPEVLCTAAFFNVAVVPEQPIVLTTMGKLLPYEIREWVGNPKTLDAFTPTPVRHWHETVAGGQPHPQEYLEDRRVYADFTTLPAIGDSLIITCTTSGRDDIQQTIQGTWKNVHVGDCNGDDGNGQSELTITFANVHDAISCQLALESEEQGRHWQTLGVRSVEVKQAITSTRK